MTYLPDPQSSPELFQGILMRRAVAWFIDLIVLGLLVLAILFGGLLIGVVTLGLGFLALPIALPIAILAYYVATLGSPLRATLGMRAMDIVLTPARGRPLDGWAILIHPLIFWVTVWVSWPITMAIALFTPRRQLLHDLIAGTLMVRRSPMERRFRYAGA